MSRQEVGCMRTKKLPDGSGRKNSVVTKIFLSLSKRLPDKMPKPPNEVFFLFPLPFSGFLYGKTIRTVDVAPLRAKRRRCGFTGSDTEPVCVSAV